MIRVRTLLASEAVSVDTIDHPDGVAHVDPPVEVSPHYSINFLERGSFSLVHERRIWTIGPNELFLTVPGQAHQFVHQEEDRAPVDVCLAVCFRDLVRDEICHELGEVGRRAPVIRLDNRLAYLRYRLRTRIDGERDTLAVDVLAAELIAAAALATDRKRYWPAQIAWYARRIDAARERLDREFAADYTLAGLARDAGMSLFHFARVFRELAGEPPHHYLQRRRLEAARTQLRNGRSVTDTCFAVGFRSLSHFITLFRRAYGVSPSAWARTRKMQRPE
jgi:AraC-like DNA-binding protein